MDVLVAVRAGDRLAGGLVAACAETAGEPLTVVHTTAEAQLALRSSGRDLLVADPDIAPPDLARDGPPVIAWTGSRSSARAAQLLGSGAEDVLDGSMLPAELVARVRRVSERLQPHLVERPVAFAGFQVDARLRTASWEGRPLPLTPRELQVLQVLVAAEGHPVSREAIYRQVWRWAMPRGDRTVDVNVTRLRGKLAASGVPVEILTQPGVGYRLAAREPAPAVTGL